MSTKRNSSRASKTQIGSLFLQMRRLSPVSVLLLCGCVSAHQIQKTRTDAAMYGAQQRARETREQCIDKGAMPGTTAYLECQLKSAKPAKQ